MSLLLVACACPAATPDRADIRVEARPYDPGTDAPAEAEAGVDDAIVVSPVYGEKAPPIARVRELCDALYVLPEQRRAACCDREATLEQARGLADECTQNVSAAVHGGGVALDDVNAGECIAALAAAQAGCDWVGPWKPPLAPACAQVLRPTRGANAACRSNLECELGLRCAGVGPTDPGVCSPPAVDGTLCNTGVDVLATYLRLDIDLDHPTCSGHCVRHRCQPSVALGGACTLQNACAAGLHCDGEVCREGPTAAVGQPCADSGCASGSVCTGHVCVAQGAVGAACETHFECRGVCQRGPAGAGVCGPQCGPLDPAFSKPIAAPNR